MNAFIKLIIFIGILVFSNGTCYAQELATPDKYDRKDVMIEMRDGIKLNTVIFTPKGQKEKLPFLMQRDPYQVVVMGSPEKDFYVQDMAEDGYIFVYQDIRGRYLSEGKFEMLKFGREKMDPKSTDESSDTYDTIDWLLKNVPLNNGKVGMWGISYDAWAALVGAIEPHPALKAISEQASPVDMFIGDDFHHNGAFRLSYSFEYAFMEEMGKTDSLFQFDHYDTYEWYLKLGPLANVNKKYFHGKLPSWNNFAKHPNYDDFWKKQSLLTKLNSPKVAIQHVAGWWDPEDFYGPQMAYQSLEKGDKHNQNYIIIGPWNHGGWAMGPGDKLGNLNFGVETGPFFRKEIQAKWFSYHLKGKGTGKFAEATVFQTGSNLWKNYTSWPPKNTILKNIYFHSDGKLSFEKPNLQETQDSDSFVSDPAKPVPYRARPIEATYSQDSRWRNWLTEDQRFVHNRPDVLSWETEELKDDVNITGNLMAKIYAATSGSDADWVVKLIDVYPGMNVDDPKMSGYQLMVANDVFRGRFRNSFSKPEAITPNKVELYTIDLHGADHVFKKGHKIMVQIQSSLFPIIDRNPQKYIPNIFEAKESDFEIATHKIFHSVKFASSIVLPIAE